jgi:hypothetical protein
MTRRVRFTPRLAAGVFAAAVAMAHPPSAQASDVPFAVQPPITTSAPGATRIFAADVDGDGDTDTLSTSTYNATIAWQQNNGDGSAWTPRVINTALVGSYGVHAADLDGDGDVDAMATSHDTGGIFWYENTAGNGTAWTRRTIALGTSVPIPISAADVDADGDQDVVVALFGASTVVWYENTAGNGSAWGPRTIATGAFGPVALAVADVDRDGDVDVVTASSQGSRLDWHDNTAGNGSAWTTRTITTNAAQPFGVAAADVDGDGDTDVLSVSYGEGKVVWLDNTAGNGSAWTMRTITTAAPAAYAVDAADVDGDGDVDVLSAALANSEVAWYENLAGNGSTWTSRIITTGGLGPFAVLTSDLDGDGDRDVVYPSFGGGSVIWHRNESIHVSACFAPKPPISTAADGAIAVLGSDVDGDGQTDVVAASINDNAVRWHENAAGNGSSWTARTITTAAGGAYGLANADVDGDGDADVLSASYDDDKIAWYDNTAGNGTDWTTRTITTAADGALAVAAADVDGDGDTDALSASFGDGRVAWYANTAGNGSAWSAVTIATGLDGAFSVAAADLDGDGDNDALSASYGDNRVAWYENTVGNGSAWVAHPVATVRGAVFVSVADVDGDGDADVLSASYGSAAALWHENASGNGSLWVTRTIAAGLGEISGIAAADLDRDGDVDALSSVAGNNEIVWHENTAGNGSAWVTRTVGAAGIPRSAAAADVDDDGDLDVLAASQSDDRVAWFEDRGGSVSLAVTDTAPPMADNGAVVSMLRVVATHLGRPGDHDVELASLGLLFEESEGDALTTAEANALVESFRVYRDGDGNGVFDPALDVLVTTVPTLTLENGIATVMLPDGDPNLQVALGSPRAYFLVVELTANASTQEPHQLRLTHLGLGALASVAEDRSFDIPLRLACPTDVSSSIKEAVPVELLGFTIE